MHQGQIDLSRQIAEQTKKLFQAHYQSKFKNSHPQYQTVLASLSLVETQTNQIKVVSIGFGTKSLPYTLAKEHQHRVIKDMHAEILARRGFCKFIEKNLPALQSDNVYFQWIDKKGKHLLRSNFRVILYCSELFCGDCMVNNKQNLYSGAKPLKYYAESQLPQQKFTKYCLRTKPGRMDLPLNKRSLSLSCSDKIGLWNIVGIQGRRLFNKIIPLYIDEVIMEVGPQQEPSRIQQGINLLKRISLIKGMKQSKIMKKVFKIMVDGKQRYISQQFRSNVPKLHLIAKTGNASTQKTLDVCGIIMGEEVSWLSGKTGLPEGVNIKKPSQKMSPFSSMAIYQNCQSNVEEQFKYTAIKDRIKLLFGEWTTDFK